MHKKFLLKRFRAFYQMFHLSVYVFFAFALLILLNPVNPRIAVAQADCDPWFSVGGWTGTFSQTGTGSGQIGNTSIVNNESASGTTTLNQAPPDCLDGREWTGVLNANVDIIREWRESCPAGSARSEKISTWRANGAVTVPARLTFSYHNAPQVYSFYGGTLLGGTINGSFESKECDGTESTLSEPIPWNLWPEMQALPPSGLILTGNGQISGPGFYVIPMNFQQSWNLTPSGQQPQPPPPPTPPPEPPTPSQPPKDIDCQKLKAGSIIGCQNQTLGEAVAIIGTPFLLHYQSDRVAGREGANVVAVDHANGLGGWTFNVHHAYDPVENVLFLGDGRRRSGDLLGSPMQTSTGEFLIASEDGSEISVFDNSGFHLRTLGGLTAITLYEFSYDAGRLISITDRNGNVTTIEHDANGTPLGIVGPFGQQTNLTVDANGFLASTYESRQ